MSHVVDIKVKITDLDALERACDKRGLELRRDRTMYNWYGRVVGSYDTPDTVSAGQSGRCDHAIGIKGTRILDRNDNSQPYEIGVVETAPGEYTLQYDFYNGGHGIERLAGGKKCTGLLEEYAQELLADEIAAYQLEGYIPQTVRNANGDLEITLTEGGGGGQWG